jgi:hypothetical protein
MSARLFWHAEVASLRLRGYEPGKSFDRRDPYAAMLRVDLFGKTTVGSAMLRADGTPLTRLDMLQIAALVRQFGGQVMLAERDGRLKQISEPVAAPEPPVGWDADTLPMDFK